MDTQHAINKAIATDVAEGYVYGQLWRDHPQERTLRDYIADLWDKSDPHKTVDAYLGIDSPDSWSRVEYQQGQAGVVIDEATRLINKMLV